MDSLKQQLEQRTQERDHWKARYETLMVEVDKEKHEKYELKQHLVDSVEQVSAQAEYCSSMGAALSTLLWRASMQDESIRAILSGSKVTEFLELAASTLDTYMATYATADDFPLDSSSPAQFVIALTGFITNLTASSYGREFLMRSAPDGDSGGTMMAVCIKVLAKMPQNACHTLRKLLLMTVYNVSINRKGFLFLCGQSNLVPLLVSFLTDASKSEECIYTLLSLQSLLHGYDKQPWPEVKQQLRTLLTDPSLEKLTSCNYADVKQAANTLQLDLQTVFAEQSHEK